MSAEDNTLNAASLFLLTFDGPVTIHFMDGGTLEGELIKQDLFNIFVQVDDQPQLISRSQIRYIQGRPGQPIVPDTASQTAFLEVVPVQADLVEVSAFDTAAVASVRPAEVDQIEAEAVELSQESAVEEGTFVFEPDTDESIPPTIDEPESPEFEPIDELADTGATFILPSSTDLLGELATAPTQDEWDDVTMVLDQAEAEEEDDITAVFPAEQEETVTARLICNTGPHAGEQFEMSGEIITLGRARDNDVSLNLDKEISRRHAVIKLNEDKFVIQDQNSLNGTYVNNERVEAPRPLQDGDVIFIGVSELIYQEG